jgi:hypothetical protein
VPHVFIDWKALMKRMHERGETVGQIITKEESRAGHEGD